MKYVYTYHPHSDYHEQLLLSIASLKKHDSEASVAVITDVDIEIDGVEVVHANEHDCGAMKANIFSYVEGDMLILDTDTLFCDKFTPVEGDVCVCKSQAVLLPVFKAMAKDYNTGVLYVRDSEKSREFFARLKALYHGDFGKAFDIVAREMGITEMQGENNVQVNYIGYHKYLDGAVILHYHASAKTIFTFPSLVLKKMNGSLTEEALAIVDNPKAKYVKPNIFKV